MPTVLEPNAPLPPASSPAALVSVLMPAFNAGQYLGESVQSILDQTYPHFELLILDDGSSDDTYAIAKSFGDARIRVLRHEHNQGLVITRNDLVKAAKGKYIAFLDADDIALPDRLKAQVALLETNTVDLCGTDHFTLNALTGKLKKSKQVHSNADIRAMMVVASPLCNPSVTGKAELFTQNTFETGTDVVEDYALWQKLSIAGCRFANLKANLLIYRVHASQISQNKLTEKLSVVAKHQEDYIAALGIDPQLRPRPLNCLERLRIAPLFLWQLNSVIHGVSIKANYQIYARFQHRGNGLWTPLTRLERLLIAMIAAAKGLWNH